MSPAAAREAVRSELRGRLDDAALNDVVLLVDEIVGNSVRHAGLSPDARIELRLHLHGARLRVEVADGGSGFEPVVREPALDATRGRGLFLVDRVADRWGVEAGGRTVVWFEMDAPPEAITGGGEPVETVRRDGSAQ
jgi:anti-sigma regulatory factor (Ser/Thr protein kinase)